MAALIGMLGLWAAAAGAERDDEIRVTHQARSLQPGEVVLVTVNADFPLEQVEAGAFGKTFPFFRVQDETWRGLIGIDLSVKAGRYRIEVTASSQRGPLRTQRPIEVLDKSFPTRRLTVDEKYVSPPPETLERIRRESRKVSSIFARTASQKRWEGAFESPVPGAPTSGFGKRSILNGKRRSPHSGVDLDADEGVPVKSPNAGRVVLAEELYYSGNTVILDHGQGLYSYFAHLSAHNVKVGEDVERGDVLGFVGATGRVTGPHLHWTVRLVRTRVDPLSLMAATGVDTTPAK